MRSFRAACVQMESGDNLADNLDRARNLLDQAAKHNAQVAALPEFFTLLAADEAAKLHIAEYPGNGPAQNLLAKTANQHKMFILGGTIPIRSLPSPPTPPPSDNPPAPQRVLAASILFAPDGQQIARYDKIHLFQFAGSRRQYDESRTILPGDRQNVRAVQTPLGKFGLSVCYDLRFPELYRAMGAPDVIFAPSAFTRETGAAHWELLLRARAVENLAHVIAPAQGGLHPGGRGTHGHSMIIGPWGDILAQAPAAGDAVVCADIRADKRQALRERLPCLQNRKLP